MKLIKYSLSVSYLPGKYMYFADHLSRSYLQDKVEDDPKMFEVVHSVSKHLPMSDAQEKCYKQQLTVTQHLN